MGKNQRKGVKIDQTENYLLPKKTNPKQNHHIRMHKTEILLPVLLCHSENISAGRPLQVLSTRFQDTVGQQKKSSSAEILNNLGGV